MQHTSLSRFKKSWKATAHIFLYHKKFVVQLQPTGLRNSLQTVNFNLHHFLNCVDFIKRARNCDSAAKQSAYRLKEIQ